MSCNMDCFSCTLPECVFDGVTEEERRQQDELDRHCARERIARECPHNLKFFDYNHSEKGKAARKRYAQTDKGKATAKRKSQKAVASGKNAEYCRRYYQKKKAEREAARWTA